MKLLKYHIIVKAKVIKHDFILKKCTQKGQQLREK